MKNKEVKAIKKRYQDSCRNQQNSKNEDKNKTHIPKDMIERLKFKFEFESIIRKNIIEILLSVLNKNEKKEYLEYLSIEPKLTKAISKYIKNLEIEVEKKYRTNNKKSISIINEDIENLELIFYNDYLIKYFTKSNYDNYDEKMNEIHLMLKDLYKIKKFIKNKKGNISIEKMKNEITFDIIDFEYVESLYFTPKIIIQDKILQIIKNSALNSEKIETIMQKIEKYFNSLNYIKNHNCFKETIGL